MKKFVALILAWVMCFSTAQAVTLEEASEFCGVDLTTCTLEELTALREQLRDLSNMTTSVSAIVSNLIDEYGAVDYTAMSLEEAATAILAAAESRNCSLKSVDLTDPDVIIINVKLSDYTTTDMLIDAIQYSCEVFKNFFTRNDVHMIYLCFFENGRTATGAPTELRTITMRLSEFTAIWLNFDYFSEYAYTVQQGYFDALDGYSLYKDYKKIIR